jgi:hypothetical protein
MPRIIIRGQPTLGMCTPLFFALTRYVPSHSVYHHNPGSTSLCLSPILDHQPESRIGNTSWSEQEELVHFDVQGLPPWRGNVRRQHRR